MTTANGNNVVNGYNTKTQSIPTSRNGNTDNKATATKGGRKMRTMTCRIGALLVISLFYNIKNDLRKWLEIEDGIPRKESWYRAATPNIIREGGGRRDPIELFRDTTPIVVQGVGPDKKKKLEKIKKSFSKYAVPFTPIPNLPQSSFVVDFVSKSTQTTHKIRIGYVGDAVRKAKEYGLINRMQGRENRADWDIVTTEICLDQDVPYMLESNHPHQKRHELPYAILIGVQKGGTTALYSYLDKHPDIIHSTKELYFLDEQIDKLLLARHKELGLTLGIPRRDIRTAYRLRMERAQMNHSKKRQPKTGARPPLPAKNGSNSKVKGPPLDLTNSKEKEWYMNHVNKRKYHYQERLAVPSATATKVYKQQRQQPIDAIEPQSRRLEEALGEDDISADGEYPSSNNSADPDAATDRQKTRIDTPESYFNLVGTSFNATNNNIRSNNVGKKILLDLTPHYIFLSDRVPQRIMCVVPWVKLFTLLRNPIDRALSNYHMKLLSLNRPTKINPIVVFGHDKPTFDEYVRMDIDALYETGVFQDWSKIPFEEFSGSEEERRAWSAYLNSGMNAPVGMGLYSLQLRMLFRQFEIHNKSIADDFLAIRSEELKVNTDETYGRVLDFLGLKRISLKKYPSINAATKAQKAKESTGEEMAPETEELLKKVFEPYNRELEKLLGDEWKDVWT